MTTTSTPEGAALVLQHALDEIANAGRSTPCQADPNPFTSDDPEERQEAAEACAGCPVLLACRHYAQTAEEPFHVWGGIDHTELARAERRAAA